MTIRPLPKPLQKKAEKEVNEDPKRVTADITALKEWLSKQPHLESVRPSKHLDTELVLQTAVLDCNSEIYLCRLEPHEILHSAWCKQLTVFSSLGCL